MTGREPDGPRRTELVKWDNESPDAEEATMTTIDAVQSTVRALEAGMGEVVIPAAGAGVDVEVRRAVRWAVAGGAVLRAVDASVYSDEDGFPVDGSVGPVVVFPAGG